MVAILRGSKDLDVVVGWPVPLWDHSSEVVSCGANAGNTGHCPRGAVGQGLYVFAPDEEPVVGHYLSLTWLALDQQSCGLATCPGQQTGTVECELCTGFGAVELVGFSAAGEAWVKKRTILDDFGGNLWSIERLVVDPSALDLDGDGLNGAQEAALGTSDYLINSDASVVNDTMEVILGTDPADPVDDPAEPTFGQLAYAASGDFVRTMPPEALAFVEDFGASILVGGGGMSGPLCNVKAGRCWFSDRVSSIAFPKGRIELPDTVAYDFIHRMSQDGSHLGMVSDRGLERFFFDGRRQIVATFDQLEALLGTHDPGRLTPWPIDAQRTFVAATLGPEHRLRVGVFDAAGAGRVAYDHATARCDSKLGDCDDRVPEGLLTNGAGYEKRHDLLLQHVIGWLSSADRLLIGVDGLLRRYVLGLHASEPPVVVGQHAGLTQLPAWIFDTGRGHLLTNLGALDTVGASGSWNRMVFESTLVKRPIGVWGDLILDPSGAGVVELVHYSDGAEPGDLLMFRPHNDPAGQRPAGYMLSRSGPRGGAVEPHRDHTEGIVDVWGVDVNAIGTMCAADRGGRALHIWTAVSPNLTPAPAITWGDLSVVDCHVQADGAVLALLREPASIVRLADPFTAPEHVQHVDGTPVQLVVPPDGGGYEVLTEEDTAVRGVGFGADGARIELVEASSGYDLRIDGGTVHSFGSDKTLYWAHIAQRPDGRIVLAPYGERLGSLLPVIDPQRGEVGPPPFGLATAKNTAIAVLPGGSSDDPWLGARAAGASAGGLEIGPDAPSGGAPVPGAGADDDGGCQGAPAPLTSGLLVVALLVFLLGRRHRDRLRSLHA